MVNLHIYRSEEVIETDRKVPKEIIETEIYYENSLFSLYPPLAQRPWAEGRSTEARGSEAVGAEWPWPYSLYHRLSHSRGSFTRDFKAVAKRENLIWWSKQEGNNLTVPIIRSRWVNCFTVSSYRLSTVKHIMNRRKWVCRDYIMGSVLRITSRSGTTITTQQIDGPWWLKDNRILETLGRLHLTPPAVFYDL